MIGLGSMVRWRSQAAGSWKEKIGKVVTVVPAGCDLSRERLNATAEQLGIDVKTPDCPGMARDHESYLVLVSRGGKKKPALYWPLVSKLQELA